jgi:hypothetical protein
MTDFARIIQTTDAVLQELPQDPDTRHEVLRMTIELARNSGWWEGRDSTLAKMQ